MRHPTWSDVRRFCEFDWQTRGGKRSDHDRYSKTLDDGAVLRTKASRGRAEIGDARLVRHVWRGQLQVSEEQFWDAVDDGNPPDRTPPVGGDITEGDGPGIPAWLVHNLITVVGLPEHVVTAMSPAAAEAAWHEYTITP